MTTYHPQRDFVRADGAGRVNLPAAVARVRRDPWSWSISESTPGEAILDAIRENA